MKQVVVREFGGPEVLEVVETPTPEPGPGHVRVRLTSIGMNHAELLGRRGGYRLSTGDPPFVPGLEGGGVIDAVGEGVDPTRVGQRVSLSPAAPRRAASDMGGTYRTHYVVPGEHALPAPDAIPDEQLGALWLSYLTAWGCLSWRENLQPGRYVAIPAASSGLGLATAQVAKRLGAVTVGLTTSQKKADALRNLPTAAFDHLIVTHNPDRSMRPWHRDMRAVTKDNPRGGVDVFFDPVASGAYLDTEIKCLAHGGTVWVYGLLGDPGAVDVTPLIRKDAAIRGWALTSYIVAEGRDGDEPWRRGCEAVLMGFAEGAFRQHVGATYPLADVRRAHEEMERGEHVGKLVLVP